MTFSSRFLIYGFNKGDDIYFIDSELGKDRAKEKVRKHAKVFPGRFEKYLLYVADRCVEEIKT